MTAGKLRRCNPSHKAKWRVLIESFTCSILKISEKQCHEKIYKVDYVIYACTIYRQSNDTFIECLFMATSKIDICVFVFMNIIFTLSLHILCFSLFFSHTQMKILDEFLVSITSVWQKWLLHFLNALNFIQVHLGFWLHINSHG